MWKKRILSSSTKTSETTDRFKQIQTGAKNNKDEKRETRKGEYSLLRSLLTSSVLLSNQLKSPFFWRKTKKKKRRRKTIFFNGRNQLKRTFYIFVFTSNRSFLHKSTRFTNKKHYEVFTNASNNKLKHKYGNFNFKRRPRRVGFLVRVSYIFTFFIYARFCWIFFLLFYTVVLGSRNHHHHHHHPYSIIRWR